jgi:hypothetical protein
MPHEVSQTLNCAEASVVTSKTTRVENDDENALCQLKAAMASVTPWNAGTPFCLPNASAACALLERRQTSASFTSDDAQN